MAVRLSSLLSKPIEVARPCTPVLVVALLALATTGCTPGVLDGGEREAGGSEPAPVDSPPRSSDETEPPPTDSPSSPGDFIIGEEPKRVSIFPGGANEALAARQVDQLPSGDTLPDCGADCQAYCASLELENPVDQAMCPVTWGAGLSTRPIDDTEACRRIFGDMIGRLPTADEVEAVCVDRSYGEVVDTLMHTDDFVRVNRRMWADRLLLNNQAVSVRRIFDADHLVARMYRGEVPYDVFAAAISAHPVITRRYETPDERAEAAFTLLMGRPPLGPETSDLARLYNLWHDGYYDDPELGDQIPDAFIRFRCVGDDGQPDALSIGECTSTQWGLNQLILDPAGRGTINADGERVMWAGLLRADEWEALQLPGRVLADEPAFWETAVDQVVEQYLGYDLTRRLPQVREALIATLMTHDADIRAVHHAVLTSQVYLQTAHADAPTDHRWTRGRLKQADAEAWIESIEAMTGTELGACDHRIPQPRKLLKKGTSGAMDFIARSDWSLDSQGEVDDAYLRLARSLGGCPINEVGGRFKLVSVLTTARQLSYVTQVCNPTLKSELSGAPIGELLPEGVGADAAVGPELAAQIYTHQARRFLGRQPTADELSQARTHGQACSQSSCTAEQFARPTCYALLSSSEMLFY